MEYVCSCLIGYLLGNLSPSYLMGRRKGYDVREDGSGNAGATNTFILLGAKAFYLTAVLDILKAFAACRLCAALFPDRPGIWALGGAACVIGHIYPVLLGFRGGKGLASLGGVVLAWNWKCFFVLLAAAVVIAFTTRYVCLVAPAMSLLFPLWYYLSTRMLTATLFLLLPAAAIFARHMENFARIRAGTEMRTSFLWDKEKELRRIGKWNPVTEEQLDRRGK